MSTWRINIIIRTTLPLFLYLNVYVCVCVNNVNKQRWQWYILVIIWAYLRVVFLLPPDRSNSVEFLITQPEITGLQYKAMIPSVCWQARRLRSPQRNPSLFWDGKQTDWDNIHSMESSFTWIAWHWGEPGKYDWGWVKSSRDPRRLLYLHILSFPRLQILRRRFLWHCGGIITVKLVQFESKEPSH